MKTYVFAILFFCIFPATQGYAESSESQGKVTASPSGDGTIAATIVGATGGPLELKLRDLASGRKLTSHAASVPMNLLLLVDASSVCVSSKLDQNWAAWLTQLKADLNPESFVTVATFTSNTFEVLAKDRPVSDLEVMGLSCQSKSLSTSYEKPLLKLLDETKKKGKLATQVWVFSSGNIQLSSEAVSRVKSLPLHVQVVLYNAFLENDLRGLVQRQNDAIGAEKISLTTYATGLFPERWFTLSAEVPFSLRGKNASYEITALKGGKEVARGNFAGVLIPASPPSFWERFGRFILIALAVCAVALVTYALYRTYRTKVCSVCQKIMPFERPVCLFCEPGDSGYLVGKFNDHEREKAGKDDVVLVRGVTEIGTHRKSAIRLSRYRGEGRTVKVKIYQWKDAAGRLAYVASSSGHASVNGVTLHGERHLSSGDEITTHDKTMTFITREDKP